MTVRPRPRERRAGGGGGGRGARGRWAGQTSSEKGVQLLVKTVEKLPLNRFGQFCLTDNYPGPTVRWAALVGREGGGAQSRA